MKKSLLVLSAASLAASSAMAQTYSAANDKCVKQATGSTLTTIAAKAAMPLHCRPEVTFYITGATAQAGYMTGTAVPNLFLESGYFTIREGNGTDANAPATRKGDSSSVGWYGTGNALSGAAGKRIYIAYNPKGSIEGVMQVMSPKATEAEATWSYPGDDGKCFQSAATTTYFCGAYKAMETGLALSDVKPEEGDLVWMKAANGGKALPKYDSSALLSTPVGLQAFGLIVNNNFYKALRDRDIARGYLPASCDSEAFSGTTVTSACRPTMSRHEYASLIATDGAKDLTFLLGASGASSALVVNRRYGGSGTQASSNMYFLNNPCGGRGFASTTTKASDGLGLNIDKTDKVVSNTYGGGLIPRSGAAATTSAGVTGTSYGNISVVEWTSGSDLAGANGVGSATGFQIGVRNVSADDNALWKWIKLDGVDPIGSDTTGFKSGATTATGAAVAPFNYNLRTGRYPFAVVFYTVMTQAAAKKTTDPVTKMATELNKALLTPQVTLSGIASLPANAANSIEVMRGTLSRPGNNNCAPLKMTGA
jgi:hypothetical protein